MRLRTDGAVADDAWRARWHGRERFVVLSTGPGGTRAFVDAWRVWRDDPGHCERLHWIALDADLPALDRADGPDAASAHAAGTDLLCRLAAEWPPRTPDLHRLAFDDARVQLLLAPGDPALWLPKIVASVDAFLVLEPRRGPGLLVEEPRRAKAFARLAAREATLSAQPVDSAARAALQAAGFRFATDASSVSIASAQHRPVAAARPPIGRARHRTSPERRVLVVGAGLAGCATALALAETGWRCSVLERHAAIAAEASGNPAGLFHGIVNGQDGTHARFHRRAALEAARAVEIAITAHAVAGSVEGLLQLVDAPHSVRTMRALLERLELPPTYVQALDADAASRRAGLRLDRGAWFYPRGGWVDPAGLARSFLERAGPAAELRCATPVAALRRRADAWEALDEGGRVLDAAGAVVLANAGEALRLVGGGWPVDPVRGQLSVLRAADAASLPRPLLPIAGSGYAVALPDGRLVFGATAAIDDPDPAVRRTDHLQNVAQLARMAPAYRAAGAGLDIDGLDGRTRWRWSSRDRLPLLGAAPLSAEDAVAGGAQPMRRDQPRFVEREAGLFICTALGSRGISWAALAGQVLAAQISGAPSPLDAGLLDAVDPARFQVRESRRRRGGA